MYGNGPQSVVRPNGRDMMLGLGKFIDVGALSRDPGFLVLAQATRRGSESLLSWFT